VESRESMEVVVVRGGKESRRGWCGQCGEKDSSGRHAWGRVMTSGESSDGPWTHFLLVLVGSLQLGALSSEPESVSFFGRAAGMVRLWEEAGVRRGGYEAR
jgi:hypothetical protein